MRSIKEGKKGRKSGNSTALQGFRKVGCGAYPVTEARKAEKRKECHF